MSEPVWATGVIFSQAPQKDSEGLFGQNKVSKFSHQQIFSDGKFGFFDMWHEIVVIRS